MGWNVIIIAFALAMDAFAVAVSNGIFVKRLKPVHTMRFGSYFGIFQGSMAALGYLLGQSFSVYIQNAAHWVAFGLLTWIGLKMFLDTFRESEEPKFMNAMESHRTMLILAIATSIDALAVGISFSVLRGPIVVPAFAIAAVSFGMSALGVYLGYKIGRLFESYAERIGGLLLSAMGLKILADHLAQSV